VIENTGGGALSLVKQGSGTLILSGANTFTGGTTINAGTLQVNAGGTGNTPLGSGPVTVNSGATLVGGNADAFGYAGGAAPASIAINGGTVTNLGTSNYRVTLPNLTFTGGTLTSAAGNTGDQYGTFSFYGNGSAATVTTLASTATATISGGSVSLEVPTTFNVAAGTTASGVDLLVAAPLTPFGGFAPDTLTKVGNGTMVLTAANTYDGATTITAGTLQLGDGTAGHDGSLATSGITDNAALVYDLNGNQTAGYIIGGSGTLTKGGPGTLTLTAQNTFTGGSTVNAGTLTLGDGTHGATLVGLSPGGTTGGVGGQAVTVGGGTLIVQANAQVGGGGGGNGGATVNDVTYFAGGNGGMGVSIAANGNLSNGGTVSGGGGGTGYGPGPGTPGGAGGMGVSIAANGNLSNTGTINGGSGGPNGGFGAYGGGGGVGVSLAASGGLTNTVAVPGVRSAAEPWVSAVPAWSPPDRSPTPGRSTAEPAGSGSGPTIRAVPAALASPSAGRCPTPAPSVAGTAGPRPLRASLASAGSGPASPAAANRPTAARSAAATVETGTSAAARAARASPSSPVAG